MSGDGEMLPIHGSVATMEVTPGASLWTDAPGPPAGISQRGG